jgi:hypothetical protein
MRAVTFSTTGALKIKFYPCVGDKCKSQEEITAIVEEGVHLQPYYNIQELDVQTIERPIKKSWVWATDFPKATSILDLVYTF